MDDGDSDDGLEEGVGESSWPAAARAVSSSAAGLVSSSSGGVGGANNGPLSQDVRKGIYHRLRAIGNEEALSDPFFEQLLDEHYERLPARYVCLRHPLSLPRRASYARSPSLKTLLSVSCPCAGAATPSTCRWRGRRTCCCTGGSSPSAPTPTSAQSSTHASYA
jgi:hypothetical protein